MSIILCTYVILPLSLSSYLTPHFHAVGWLFPLFHEVRTGTVIEVGRVLHVYTLDYTTSHIKANVKL
jgi:hypothetical protein